MNFLLLRPPKANPLLRVPATQRFIVLFFGQKKHL